MTPVRPAQLALAKPLCGGNCVLLRGDRDNPVVLAFIAKHGHRPRLLDLFSGADGAAMGYYRAGFDVVGVDIKPQPHYPFEFHQADAMTYSLDGFVAYHASPPCQAFTPMQHIRKNAAAHLDLLEPTRLRLAATGAPYVIENVMTAPLDAQLLLCGTMFGLRIAKHRLFEANWSLPFPPFTCNHADVFDPWHGKGRTAVEFRAAQDTPWIPVNGGASRKSGRSGDTTNAIPPAYTEYIGTQLMAVLS